jgi:hypothetical protein
LELSHLISALPLTGNTVNPDAFLSLPGNTVNPGAFLPLPGDTVNQGAILSLPEDAVDCGALLSLPEDAVDCGALLPSALLFLPVSIDDRTFLQITVTPLMQQLLPFLQFTLNAMLFLPAALEFGIITEIPLNSCTTVANTAPLPIQHFPLGEPPDITTEISAALRILSKLPGGVLVTIGDPPPVNRDMRPPAGLCHPAVVPDISGSIVDIDEDIMAGPVEIAPRTPGKTEIDTGPI